MVEKSLQDLYEKVMSPNFRVSTLSSADTQAMHEISYNALLELKPVSYSLQICFEPFSMKSPSINPDEILNNLKSNMSDTDEARMYVLIATYIMWLVCVIRESYRTERVAKALFELSLLRTVKDLSLPIFAI